MNSTPYSPCSGHANRGDIRVDQTESGLRLDVFLAHSERFHETIGKKISRSKIIKGIKNGGISRAHPRSNFSVLPDPDTIVSVGDRICVAREAFIGTENDEFLLEPGLPISVILETKDFLVINKPAGIESHPTPHKRSGTVVNWLLAAYPDIKNVGEDASRPGIVHRLDRDTSGVLIIARTNRAFSALKQAFKQRLVKKRYLAVVSGIPHTSERVINTPLARSSRGNRQAVATPRNRTRGAIRPAETGYRLKETFPGASLVELEPKTGRTHQIRVHLSSIGHPILGDRLYGRKKPASSIEYPSRQLLHALSIEFPLFGRNYSANAPLPPDLEESLERLRGK